MIDPANGIDCIMDIAVAGKAIARVAENIPAEQAKKAIDVAGYYVTPGLVDIHVHVFGYRGSIWPDDTHLTQGETTVADCGGSGWRTFDEFKQMVIDRAKTRIYAFINIVGRGMVGSQAENDVTDMDQTRPPRRSSNIPTSSSASRRRTLPARVIYRWSVRSRRADARTRRSSSTCKSSLIRHAIRRQSSLRSFVPATFIPT